MGKNEELGTKYSNKDCYARKKAHVRYLPFAKVLRKASWLYPIQDLALAHRLVSWLESLPEVASREIMREFIQ